MAQILLWITFLPPWLLILPLDKKRVRRFLSVAFFTLLLTSINWQIGEVVNWWEVPNNLFFLTNISAFNYGFLPVVTIYVFYFTYPNPWLFFGANIIIDAIQAFIINPFIFQKLGLIKMINMNNFEAFLLTIMLVPIIYFYQRWYDKE
ncbi:hypothetical protein OXPF_33790 [Oxobacter pfennigii]|uniref:Lycopene cyclase domain-containing protein n=1 Tax=Oxobacter pfennigii TaxID=36849 RepID=A0A0P8W3G2_9CLOT|nr:hypothetical protein [Oxobacter pfennigii]KPU43129.1 hypothetical protein OXPF_33790 [Oxobacter pfennigii]